jgi:hypothetical protein
MENTTEKQRIIDSEHLRLLSVFHFIQGFMTIGVSLIFIFHFALFSFLTGFADNNAFGYGSDAEMSYKILGLISTLFGLFIVIGVTFGIMQILSAVFLQKRKNRTFSIIISAFEILHTPYGTILGISSLYVLNRESVKELYSE